MSAPQVTISQRGHQLVPYVASLSATRNDRLGAEAHATAKGNRSIAAVHRGVVTALSQGDVSNAMAPVTFDLAEVLRPAIVLGRLQGLRRVPFRVRLLAQSTGLGAAWTAEGAPIPAHAAGFRFVEELTPLKVSGISVISSELLTQAIPASYPVIAADIVAGVAEAIDVSFLDPSNSGSAVEPASITAGAPSFESGGATLAAIDSDLQRLVGSLTDANNSLATASWIMRPRTAAFLSTLRGSGGAAAYPLITARGGTLMGLPVVTSANLIPSGSPGESLIVLVEASEVCLADDDGGDVEVSSATSLQLSDTPGAGGQAEISLWQNNLVAIKSTRITNWAVRRATSVAVLRSVMY